MNQNKNKEILNKLDTDDENNKKEKPEKIDCKIPQSEKDVERLEYFAE